jgi:hypothetical protein
MWTAVNAGRDAEQNHAVLRAELCRRFFHGLFPPPTLGKGEGSHCRFRSGLSSAVVWATQGRAVVIAAAALRELGNKSQAVIVGSVSLEAAPPRRQDDAETALIIVNGRKGLNEHSHRGATRVLP